VSIENSELISASIVLVGANVLAVESEVAAFRTRVATELIAMSAQDAGQTDARARKLTLQKDRITIDSNARGSIIKQEFPQDEFVRLSYIASEAIRHTESPGQVVAHGYNIEIIFDQNMHQSSFYYVADLMFKGVPCPEGCSVRGGRAYVSFHDGKNRVWNVTLEPRFRNEDTNKVFFSLNSHNVGGPALQDIESQFRRTKNMADRFISTFLVD